MTRNFLLHIAKWPSKTLKERFLSLEFPSQTHFFSFVVCLVHRDVENVPFQDVTPALTPRVFSWKQVNESQTQIANDPLSQMYVFVFVFC